MLQREHSAILSTLNKLLVVIKTFVLSILSGRCTQVFTCEKLIIRVSIVFYLRFESRAIALAIEKKRVQFLQLEKG